MLCVDVTKRFEQLTIEARFASEGGVTALFGRSGAGKTSIVSMIAGLLRPDRGRIELDGDTLDDTSAGIHLPAWRRHIGYVFQDARLFPHLSVAENLDYGRRMNRLVRDEAGAARVVRLLDLDELLGRRPGKLSGGEKQRVALGRALLAKPRLLLLDEPLGSLDDERKAEILPYLVRLRDQSAVPMIYVSHSADEVRMLATQVIQLQDGRIVASGGADILAGAEPTVTR
jgi:molybdate transport system ATP-binding protein